MRSYRLERGCEANPKISEDLNSSLQIPGFFNSTAMRCFANSNIRGDKSIIVAFVKRSEARIAAVISPVPQAHSRRLPEMLLVICVARVNRCLKLKLLPQLLGRNSGIIQRRCREELLDSIFILILMLMKCHGTGPNKDLLICKQSAFETESPA